MKSMRRWSWVAVLTGLAGLLLAGAAASAQQVAPGTAPAAAMDSHEAAARELIQLVDLKKTALSGGMAMFDAQMQANPKMARYADVMRSWVTKVFQEMDMEGAVVQLYKENFSEAELRDIIAFYRTPTGRKALTKMPELMQKGMAIGMERAQAHLGELREMIAQRDKELGEEKPGAGQPAVAAPPPLRRP